MRGRYGDLVAVRGADTAESLAVPGELIDGSCGETLSARAFTAAAAQRCARYPFVLAMLASAVDRPEGGGRNGGQQNPRQQDQGKDKHQPLGRGRVEGTPDDESRRQPPTRTGRLALHQPTLHPAREDLPHPRRMIGCRHDHPIRRRRAPAGRLAPSSSGSDEEGFTPSRESVAARRFPEGETSVAIGEAPVLEALTEINAVSLSRVELDPATLVLVRIAALAAVNAPPASYLLHVGPAVESGVKLDDVQDVLVAVAPIVGAPRVLRAAGAITKALGVAIAITDAAAAEAASEGDV
jgi:alkylhydroperoxidase/carboxymuconolactone decarboxylase family protein YurZ